MPPTLPSASSLSTAGGITLTHHGCWRSASDFIPSTSPSYLDDLIALLDEQGVLPSLTSRLLHRERELLYQHHPHLFTAPPNAYTYPSPPPSSSSSPSVASFSSLPSPSSVSSDFSRHPSPVSYSGSYPVSSARDYPSPSSSPPSQPGRLILPVPSNLPSPPSPPPSRRKRRTSSSSTSRYHPYGDHSSVQPILRPASFDEPPSPLPSSSSTYSSPLSSCSSLPLPPPDKRRISPPMKLVSYSATNFLQVKNRAARDRKFRNAAQRYAQLKADECVYYFDHVEAVCAGCMVPIKLCGKGRYYDTNWKRHKKKCLYIEDDKLIRITTSSTADSQVRNAAVNVTQYPTPL
ncbi:hypothetical protein CONPUDRAFT_166262 [Coniophora puteana RWD-64-598 SS2]|uniref:Uncharacterized protein n=1 Tax=Coniophora puteana (strain RWD-64-598) TaxID=741705 RepID=A0A5M3MLE2_CONPW|nr:uncharacterized protein CONPUDRAFT_166262 [Coniophora puteana RWD-64-598 SS2]EIW79495.1 hypothetical protein CONPUDRAFT_166262 [Coniophora puteana RWD-64-598 SS2]